MTNSQSPNFNLKGSIGGSEHRTSAVAGLLYGDSSRAVNVPDPNEVLKSILEQIRKSFDEIRDSGNENEYIAKVKTMISNTREAMDINYKSGLIKENDLDLIKKFIDEIEVSINK